MKVYRVSVTGGEGSVVNAEHQGYEYYSTKRAVSSSLREAKRLNYTAEVHEINIEVSKRGILTALNNYGGHPDNG